MRSIRRSSISTPGMPGIPPWRPKAPAEVAVASNPAASAAIPIDLVFERISVPPVDDALHDPGRGRAVYARC